MSGWVRTLLEKAAADVTPQADERHSVVLAPHPDDEVLGCGGTIARKVRRGVNVSVVFLTDGRYGAAGTPDAVRRRRESEALRAAAALGLSQDRLVFLGFEDKHLRTHVDEAARRVREVVNTFGACDLFVPFRAEYQDDHLAAWQIGRTSLPSHGRMYEYPVWFGPWLWRRLGWRARAAAVLHLLEARHAVKVCVSDVADMKRRALDAYASQVSAFERLGPWGRGFLDGFLGPYELFFVRR